MNVAIVVNAIRYLLMVSGAGSVLSPDTVTQIATAVAGAVGLAWTIYKEIKTAKELAVAKAAAVTPVANAVDPGQVGG